MKIFLLVATHYGVGLTSVSLSLLHKLDSLGYKTGFFKPVSQTDNPIDQSTKLAEILTSQVIYSNISCLDAKNKFASGQQELLMEEIIATFEKQNNNLDALVIEGLMPVKHLPYANQINSAVAKSLNADIIIVSEVYNMSANAITNSIEITASTFGPSYSSNILGYIINKVLIDESKVKNLEKLITKASKTKFKCLAIMPYDPEFSAPLMSDLADELQAKVINKGDINNRRVKYYTLIARTVENALGSVKPGNLIITPADRSDIILAVCMAALSGVKLAGLLLTGGMNPAASVMELCKHALETGLPIISIDHTSYATVALIDRLPKKISVKDKNHLHKIVQDMSLNISGNDFRKYFQGVTKKTLSPAAFRYQLIKKAKQQTKTIILPEGHDPRIIESAIICHQRNIANCILLGNKNQIHKLANDSGLVLPDNLTIKQPANVRSKYVAPLIEIRKHKKKLNEYMALSYLEDDIVLGTMMLALNEVDGLVAGACTTTANTLRPAFQIIKASGGLVSSIFFMLMPTDVFIYGDCAVNTNPSAEQLALIAIQSADSAKLFGIEPRIAMISYSTGMSGSGDDVELVRQATNIIQKQRSDLIIDGPLQYDAASVATVAKTKAPNSKIAGNANVFIFPNLNTGNTTYKAVQRSAGVVSLGPMLQGLNKPVNDLSRGASIDDIVYTIALTAIQAQN